MSETASRPVSARLSDIFRKLADRLQPEVKPAPKAYVEWREKVLPWTALHHPFLQILLSDWKDVAPKFNTERFLVVTEERDWSDYRTGVATGRDVMVISDRWPEDMAPSMREAICLVALYQVKGVQFTETICRLNAVTYAEARKLGTSLRNAF